MDGRLNQPLFHHPPPGQHTPSMLSLPNLRPPDADARGLWHEPLVRPHIMRRSARPWLRLNRFPRELLPQRPASIRPGEPLARLEDAELRNFEERDAVRTFGFTFMRPPGFTKTEQALIEEQAMSDSESEDNGLMENPNQGLTVRRFDLGEDEDEEEEGEDEDEEDEEGALDEQLALNDSELDDPVGDEEDEIQEEYDDDDDPVDVADLDLDRDAQEALDGWPRRRRRRFVRVNQEAEEEDLDADIPEGDDITAAYADDDDEEEGVDEYGDDSSFAPLDFGASTHDEGVEGDEDEEMGMEFD
ncbi:uncharacterized protein V1518DRAFT_411738, partial [Limtongia smithiae]|uniref:uncharacterized protein n=1 Tax=Limtongia smithiae TaxID=1125753 RepID=UPI0034CEDB43